MGARVKPPVWPADKVERRAVASLVPYARNARTHSEEQVAQIAASIREWGWTVPVLVDDQGSLIAGHGRVLAARKLGITDVPVMVARGWSAAQIASYRLTDNKLALNAGWDDELLRLELGELGLEGFDLGLIGFSDLELKDILDGPVEPLPPDGFDSYDEDIETEHQCPKCGYVFSGGKTVAKAEAAE
jgi:ParB-like chromosome segregation protein Spo0J